MSNIVTLSDNLLYRYTDRELTDLAEYFDPSAILVDGAPTQDQVERVESVTRKEALPQEDAPFSRELDDVVVGCVGTPSDIADLPDLDIRDTLPAFRIKFHLICGNSIISQGFTKTTSAAR